MILSSFYIWINKYARESNYELFPKHDIYLPVLTHKMKVCNYYDYVIEY